jgi:hypothetical protein
MTQLLWGIGFWEFFYYKSKVRWLFSTLYLVRVAFKLLSQFKICCLVCNQNYPLTYIISSASCLQNFVTVSARLLLLQLMTGWLVNWKWKNSSMRGCISELWSTHAQSQWRVRQVNQLIQVSSSHAGTIQQRNHLRLISHGCLSVCKEKHALLKSVGVSFSFPCVP